MKINKKSKDIIKYSYLKQTIEKNINGKDKYDQYEVKVKKRLKRTIKRSEIIISEKTEKVEKDGEES